MVFASTRYVQLFFLLLNDVAVLLPFIKNNIINERRKYRRASIVGPKFGSQRVLMRPPCPHRWDTGVMRRLKSCFAR
jgi:hypothetical protein